MKLSDKIIGLRKSNGMSQEDLAEKLDVSRQAISRWESGTAMPDANNILQLSKLFGVTTDYLLNDDYQSDNDLPKVKEVQNDNLGQIMVYLVTLEVMVLLIQFMTTVILQNVFFGFLSFLPFVAAIGGFEYAYQKKASSATEKTKKNSDVNSCCGYVKPMWWLKTVILSTMKSSKQRRISYETFR